MFSKIITVVIFPFIPIHEDELLIYLIMNPVEYHVHRFRSSYFDSFSNNTEYSYVISVLIGVGGCKCPNSCSVVLMGMTLRVL